MLHLYNFASSHCCQGKNKNFFTPASFRLNVKHLYEWASSARTAWNPINYLESSFGKLTLSNRPLFFNTQIYFFFTCEVDMREVSCRPVKSDEEILTGAPRCNLILTFLSRSIPDTGRGEVLAVRKTALDSHKEKCHFNTVTGKITLLLFAHKNPRKPNKRNQGHCLTFHRNSSTNWQAMSVCNYLQCTKKQGRKKTNQKAKLCPETNCKLE